MPEMRSVTFFAGAVSSDDAFEAVLLVVRVCCFFGGVVGSSSEGMGAGATFLGCLFSLLRLLPIGRWWRGRKVGKSEF